MNSPLQQLALSGIRVLDFSQYLSGPFGTQILADLGADVIKIEGPPIGDPARTFPPHFVGKDSVYFLSVNRNKRSIVVDLKNDKGVELVRRLILASDVVIENFRPGVLARLSLSTDELRAQKQSLIWCSISGFGQTGPFRDKPAYDMIVQALSGGMSLTGEADGPPVRAGIPIADLAAGMYATIGILAALHRRVTTGQGDYVDISMLDCQSAMLCYQAAYYLHSGRVPSRQGTGHDSISTYRTFRTRDQIDLVVTAITEQMWCGLCKALSREQLITDSRFTSSKDRHTNRIELWPLLEEAFLQRDAAEWVQILETHQVPVGMVNTLDRVASSPQIAAREMVVELESKDGQSTRVMGNPLNMQGSRNSHSFPPLAGEHSQTILSEILGLKSQEIESLIASKVVATLGHATEEV